MAIYHSNHRPEDIGHGTRAGFRYVSLFGSIAFVLFIAFFIWGPSKTQTENPASNAEENTQLEKQVVPPKQPENPATAPQAQPQPQPPAPQPATP